MLYKSEPSPSLIDLEVANRSRVSARRGKLILLGDRLTMGADEPSPRNGKSSIPTDQPASRNGKPTIHNSHSPAGNGELPKRNGHTKMETRRQALVGNLIPDGQIRAFGAKSMQALHDSTEEAQFKNTKLCVAPH